jgi:hypothetical protein
VGAAFRGPMVGPAEAGPHEDQEAGPHEDQKYRSAQRRNVGQLGPAV